MKPFINITFASGHVFQMPAAAVAENRTAYYRMIEPDRTPEQHAAETAMLFESDAAVFDWVRGNMNWRDVEKLAHLVAFKPADFVGSWQDAELMAADESTKPDLVAMGNRIVDAPIELALSQANVEGVNCLMFGVLSQEPGQINMAIAALLGPAEVTHAYIAAIHHFDQYMRHKALAAATPASPAIN